MTSERSGDDGEFIAYPAGYVIGVVEDPGEGDRVAAELRSSGFEESGLLRFTGERGARRIDPTGAEHGLLARLIRFLEYSDDSRQQAEAYAEESRAGHCVIAVHAPEDEERERAREVLKAHGGRFINYYSPHGFTETLDP